VVVDFSRETPVVTDGPYGETKELFDGFSVIEVASGEEAVEGDAIPRRPMSRAGSSRPRP
jgi:hypothetical protein